MNGNAMKARRLKVALIREELVAITGDFAKAVILNQMLYWSERVDDFDSFIAAENKRAESHGLPTSDATDGWFYKTADELSDETMLGQSAVNMRRHIKALENMGFISERNNPKYQWDKTKQYRVNLIEIVDALAEKGYALNDYRVQIDLPNLRNGSYILKVYTNNLKVDKLQNVGAIPETTTETTNREEYVPELSVSGKSPRHEYGQYKNVMLTDKDMDKIKAEYPDDWQERIERLSEYMASKGTKYKNHLATIRAWARKDASKPTEKPKDDPYENYTIRW